MIMPKFTRNVAISFTCLFTQKRNVTRDFALVK